MPTHDRFNYRRLLIRTDPTCNGANTAARITARLDTAAVIALDLENTLPVIAGIWAEVSPDPDPLSEMLAILTGFIDRAAPQSVTSWDQVSATTVNTPPGQARRTPCFWLVANDRSTRLPAVSGSSRSCS